LTGDKKADKRFFLFIIEDLRPSLLENVHWIQIRNFFLFFFSVFESVAESVVKAFLCNIVFCFLRGLGYIVKQMIVFNSPLYAVLSFNFSLCAK